MAKVMLVEDDNNLREIYEARLAAEGYEIVSAHDGEEALAIAVKEQPDLIISDIMMPKISGFDMLDILRSTPETQHTKIVMMTALSQAEDKERAGKLGADKYLVKSQVTLEDVVRVAKELLDDITAPQPASTTNAPDPAAPASDDAVASSIPVVTAPSQGPTVDTSVPPAPAADAVAVNDDPVTVPTPEPVAPVTVDDTPTPAADVAVPTPAADVAVPTPAPPAPTPPPADAQPDIGSTDDPDDTSTTASTTVEDQIKDFISTAEQVKNNASTPYTPPPAAPTQIPVMSADEPAAPVAAVPATPTEPQLATPSGQKKVIAPINDLSQGGPDLDALLAQEESKPADTTTPIPSVNTVISPDGTLSYASSPPIETPTNPDTPLVQPPAESGDAPVQEPHQPGQKIDPDSIAL
jgi:CheY-like chemotaxis protein